MAVVMLTAEEIKARVANIPTVDDLLSQIEADDKIVTAPTKKTLAQETEDYIARIIPLLVPFLGPAETWVNLLAEGAAGPAGPIVSILMTLVEKAATNAALKWAANEVANQPLIVPYDTVERKTAVPMDPKNILAKLWSTLHALANDNRAVTTVASVIASGITMLCGILMAHYGQKLGLAPDLAMFIPKLAGGLSILIVGSAVSYAHGTAKVDAAGVQTGASFKDEMQEFMVEAMQAVITSQTSGGTVPAPTVASVRMSIARKKAVAPPR